jgi:hypothetical protein
MDDDSPINGLDFTGHSSKANAEHSTRDNYHAARRQEMACKPYQCRTNAAPMLKGVVAVEFETLCMN